MENQPFQSSFGMENQPFQSSFGMDYAVPGVLGGLGQGYVQPNLMYSWEGNRFGGRTNDLAFESRRRRTNALAFESPEERAISMAYGRY